MISDITPAMVEAFNANVRVQNDRIISLQAGLKAAMLASTLSAAPKAIKLSPQEFHFDLFNSLSNERIGYVKTRAEPRAGEKMMDNDGQTYIVQEVVHPFVTASPESKMTARTLAVFATPIAGAIALRPSSAAKALRETPIGIEAANTDKPVLSLPTEAKTIEGAAAAPIPSTTKVLEVKPAVPKKSPTAAPNHPSAPIGGRRIAGNYENADPRMQYVSASSYKGMAFKTQWGTLVTRSKAGDGPRLARLSDYALGFEKTAFMEWARMNFAKVPRSVIEKTA